MTAATLERSVEDVLADEIMRTEARLEALRFAHSVLTGNRPLTLVPPETKTPLPPPATEKPDGRRTKRRYSDEEKVRIVDRAHELRSMSKAAEESGASIASIHVWNKEQGRGLPGAKLPAQAADELREGAGGERFVHDD